MFFNKSKNNELSRISPELLENLLGEVMAGNMNGLAHYPELRGFFEKLASFTKDKDEDLVYALSEVNRLNQYIIKMDFIKNMISNLNEQKDAVEMVAASSQEISASIEDIADVVSNNAQAAEKSVAITTTGSHDLKEAVKIIDEAYELTGLAKSKVLDVTQQAAKIGGMIAIIESVAEQTNLLALNASIEAARAGEAGRGFAVVADEIKKLAESTKASVKHIQGTVSSLSASVENSVEAIEQATQSFQIGVNKVNSAQTLVEESDVEVRSILTGLESVRDQVAAQAQASYEVANSTALINEKTKVLYQQTNRTGRAFSDIASEVNSIRMDLFNKTKNISDATMLDIVITDHLNWKWMVYNMILGYQKIDNREVGTHNDCQLGKWVNTYANSVPAFRDHLSHLNGPHEKLHKMAAEAVRAYNAGDIRGAERHYENVGVLSNAVVTELNAMLAAIAENHGESATTKFFRWTSDLTVYNSVIDEQHKRLLVLGEKLEGFKASPTRSKAEFLKITDELKSYTVYHFENEEKMLENAHYPDIHKHKQIHKAFVSEITNIDFSRFDFNSDAELQKLILLVSKWVIKHIRNEDFKYSNYLSDY